MQKIIVDNEFFNIKDTLECGQVFRFFSEENGYVVISTDKCAFVYEDGDKTVIESDYPDYFHNYFDLDRDYKEVFLKAQSYGVEVLNLASNIGKGIRILNQDPEETLFSFIISQNNNIPRIKVTIEKLCKELGNPIEFKGKTYYGFPKAERLSLKDCGFYKALGFGYRDKFMVDVSSKVYKGVDFKELKKLPYKELKKALLEFNGVGPKVADCVSLFGFGKTEGFPVDTWIEKLYKENFDGKLLDRNKIADFFTEKFGNYSGYVQQYLFYYKRSIEEKR